MTIALLGQYLVNGLMLGLMYGLVAVGFTLFFGVLDVIKFSHGDVLTVGAFTGFATYLAIKATVSVPWLQLVIVSIAAMLAMAVLGALIARFLVLPLRSAPGPQHAADHADARHRAARERAAVLPRRLEPETVSGAAAARRLHVRAVHACGSTA